VSARRKARPAPLDATLLDLASADAVGRFAVLPHASLAVADDDDNERRINVGWSTWRPCDITVEVYKTHAGWCFKGYLTVDGEALGYRHWGTCRAYPGRNEAAAVATDYLTEALRLAVAWTNGIDLVAPDVRMRAAADHAIGPAERDERQRARLRVEWKRGRRWQDFRDPGSAQGDLFSAARSA
jgi:hypothetical protein